jgi:hypothetical protein
MNTTEAIHTQTLLVWLTDPHATAPGLADVARDSAATLAEAARHRLGAGPTRDQITTKWRDLLTDCPGCPACVPTTGEPGPAGDGDPATAGAGVGGLA